MSREETSDLGPRTSDGEKLKILPLGPGEGLEAIAARGIDLRSETAAHLYWSRVAANAAMDSTCLRSRCGAVVVGMGESLLPPSSILFGGRALSLGWNGPPRNDLAYRRCGCTAPSKAHPKADRTCCVHAEIRALFAAPWAIFPGSRRVLYFARVDAEGRILPSGRPYCTQCSKQALDCAIRSWVLWHEDGPREYDAAEYNHLSHHFDDGPPTDYSKPMVGDRTEVSDEVRQRARALLEAIYLEFEAGSGSGGEVYKTWHEGGEERARAMLEEAFAAMDRMDAVRDRGELLVEASDLLATSYYDKAQPEWADRQRRWRTRYETGQGLIGRMWCGKTLEDGVLSAAKAIPARTWATQIRTGNPEENVWHRLAQACLRAWPEREGGER